MVKGCGKVVKYALFIANFIILICGLIAVGIGVWTLVEKPFMEQLMSTDLYMTSTILILGTGVVVTIISLLGCLGAIKEIKCMLLTFFIILFVIFLIMLVCGILSYVFKDQVEDKMKKNMVGSIPKYMNDTIVTDVWDYIQKRFQCCGIEVEKKAGYEIWQYNPAFTGLIRVPRSCCKKKGTAEEAICQATPEQGAFEKGCYDTVKDFAKEHAVILAGIGIGVACVLLVGMMLSCALFLKINKREVYVAQGNF